MLNKLCMGLILWDERPLNKIKKMKKKKSQWLPLFVGLGNLPFPGTVEEPLGGKLSSSALQWIRSKQQGFNE